jgi:hypothetical protein
MDQTRVTVLHAHQHVPSWQPRQIGLPSLCRLLPSQSHPLRALRRREVAHAMLAEHRRCTSDRVCAQWFFDRTVANLALGFFGRGGGATRSCGIPASPPLDSMQRQRVRLSTIAHASSPLGRAFDCERPHGMVACKWFVTEPSSAGLASLASVYVLVVHARTNSKWTRAPRVRRSTSNHVCPSRVVVRRRRARGVRPAPAVRRATDLRTGTTTCPTMRF